MTQDSNQPPATTDQQAGRFDAERQEKINQLFQRDSKLSTEEAALLREPEVFGKIIDAHHKQVWNLLRRRRLERHDADEIYQDVFVALHDHIVEKGFPKKAPALVTEITKWKILGHVAYKNRLPPTEALPSSSSEEKARSAPDLDLIMDRRAIVQQNLPKLSPEHREVLEKVILSDLSHTAAAKALGLTEGQLKARLIAAKRALSALIEPIVPSSQRGPL